VVTINHAANPSRPRASSGAEPQPIWSKNLWLPVLPAGFKKELEIRVLVIVCCHEWQTQLRLNLGLSHCC